MPADRETLCMTSGPIFCLRGLCIEAAQTPIADDLAIFMTNFRHFLLNANNLSSILSRAAQMLDHRQCLTANINTTEV